MKYILIIITALLLTSCEPTQSTKAEPWKYDAAIVEFNGCEYVKFGFGEYTWGAHSGTCPNPIHIVKTN